MSQPQHYQWPQWGQSLSMCSITNIICIYSQNVWKNYVLVDSLLESQKDLYTILFIQEPPWNFIQFAPSTTSPGGQEVIGALIHPEWTQVVQFPQDSKQIPRVICFIHSRLSRIRFSLRRNIVNYRDIQLLSFFNRGRCQFFFSSIYYIVLNYSPWQTIQNQQSTIWGLRRQKLPSQADRDVTIVRRDQK